MATLNPALRDFWRARVTEDGTPIRFRTLYGGRMSSKCLAVGTGVLMYDGSVKPVECVAVGDQVMGPDSQPRNVLHTTSGIDEMYRVDQSHGESYTVNSAHILSLKIYGEVLNANVEYLYSMPSGFVDECAGYGLYHESTISITHVGIGEYAGFSVDGDHLFCLADGTVTHNSHDAAGVAIARANFCEQRFLCLRMFQNRIADSVYALLKDKIEYFGLSANFKVYADAIEHKSNGSLFRFYGMARNIDEIKSFERADVCWVEEAHNLTETMFNTIRPTIMRNEGAEMWFTFNPRLATDFAYKRLVSKPPGGSIVRLINYNENPFLTPTALSDIESSFEEDHDLATHVYLGVPHDSDDSVVIKRAWLMAAVDAHKKVVPVSGQWTGGRTVGYDVADSGDDKNATTTMDGMVCIDLDEWKGGEDELRESAARVRQTAMRLDASQIGYDCIGVGAGTGSHLNSLGWARHYKFNAGGKVVHPKREYAKTKIANEDFFANLKAQAWWLAADRFRNTYLAVTKGREFPADQMISLSSDCDAKLLDKLIEELSTPMRDFDNAGKVKVESKKDLAKREVVSPNIADSFIIAACRGMLARAPIGGML